jgi:hypothetical protein
MIGIAHHMAAISLKARIEIRHPLRINERFEDTADLKGPLG